MKVRFVMWVARVLGVPVDVRSSYFMQGRDNGYRYGVPHTDGKPIR